MKIVQIKRRTIYSSHWQKLSLNIILFLFRNPIGDSNHFTVVLGNGLNATLKTTKKEQKKTHEKYVDRKRKLEFYSKLFSDVFPKFQTFSHILQSAIRKRGDAKRTLLIKSQFCCSKGKRDRKLEGKSY